MKKVIYGLSLLAIAGLTYSCSDAFLEEQPTEFLSQEQVTEAAQFNPEVVEGSITGVYLNLIQTGTGGTTNHDDFGRKGYDIYSDMLCGDMSLQASAFGWYRAQITEFQAPLDFTFSRNRMPWRYYYRVIRNANLVIDALGGDENVPQLQENQWIMGQAKALRANAYFGLTQFYARDYSPNESILPIYRQGDQPNQPKSTMGEVYDLIESDLNDAITLLNGFSRSSKNQINQDVARGILAYVLGSKRDSWQDVADLTATVINGGGYELMSATDITAGFNDVSEPGWMWGFDLTLDIGLNLISWWGQVDYFSFSYAFVGDQKSIDKDLYDQIPADDARKLQWGAEDGPTPLMPVNKLYDDDRVPFGASSFATADYVFMRIAEMILLNAEANARLGNDAAAQNMLKMLLNERVPDASYVDGLTGQALLDEIYLQTRIELAFEGKSFLAMKRNQATVTRGPNHLSFVGVPISYDDERFQFEIPLDEIQNNPFISEQNF